MSAEIKIGSIVVANAGGTGFPYRARIEDIWAGKAMLLPIDVPITASSARRGNYKKRRRWVRLDRLSSPGGEE